jgi:glycine hydroxymethyltransferase
MVKSRIAKIFLEELNREEKVINLIPSECPLNPICAPYLDTNVHQKYAEGYPGKRYYNGCKVIDKIESAVIEEVAKNFECTFANVQPHSGSTANQAAYKAGNKWLQKQGMVGITPTLSMELDSGGHLSHFSPASFGKKPNHYFYSIDPMTGKFDLERIDDWMSKHKYGIIVIGASSYPFQLPLAELSKLFLKYDDGEHHFFIVFDVSHIAGLIVGKVHPNPASLFDWGKNHTWCMTSTTHKTYGGPRHAVIVWKDPELTKLINHAVFPEMQGGANFAIIAALGEWAENANKNYAWYHEIQKNILRNTQRLIEPLKDKLVFGQSQNHLALVRCKSKEHAQRVADKLEESNIIVNVNGMFDGSWGIRIGSTYETWKFNDKLEWEKIGAYIKYVIENLE